MEKLDNKNIEDILALTPMQEGMLFHYLKVPGSDYYFEQLSLEISGEIKMEVFEKAWNFIIRTNEMLRTVFRWETLKHPIQIILREHRLKPGFYDLSDKDVSQKKKRLEEIKIKDRQEKFDLREVPFRVTLYKLKKDKYCMIISNHHILYDGWSNGIILREFFTVYNDLSRGKKLEKPVKTQFKEFIQWNRNQDKPGQEKFWREYLKGFDTPTELSIKRRKQKQVKDKTNTGNYQIRFSKDLKNRVTDFVKRNKMTLATYFYSVWGLLLQRYGNSSDVIFGTTVSGKSARINGIEDMVGLFINTIPLRIKFAAGEKILDLLHRVNASLPIREKYEITSLVEIKGCSELDGNEEIFDSIIVMENYPLDSVLIGKNSQLSLVVDSYSMIESTGYDLTIGILTGDDIEISFNYKPGLFEKSAVKRLANHFINVIKNILNDPERDIHGIEILSEEERNQLLYDFNKTAAPYPRNKTLQRLFEEQVERTPDNTAAAGPVQGKYRTYMTYMTYISYRELNKRSNQLAHLLRKKGVTSDSMVGIMVEHSIEMIVGILAILKSGGAYLPISPEDPVNRRHFILADSHTGVLLLQGHLLPRSREVEKTQGVKMLYIPIDDEANYWKDSTNLALVNCPLNLAYVIYTSGTTGAPNGVLVEHRNVVNVVSNYARQYGLQPGIHVIQLSHYTFDASVDQIFASLLHGACLHVVDKSLLADMMGLRKYIDENLIHIIDFVPVLLDQLLSDQDKLESVSHVISGGERLGESLKDKLLSKGYRLFNHYGPTEAAVDALISPCSPGKVNIGKPIANLGCRILNKYGNLQPPGVPGELYIWGVGLARGYLNNQRLTMKRFTFNPFFNNQRLYRTGDLVRWLPDGNIEFLGRMDQQVKLRGFRIEPGEIENQLLNCKEVREAVVCVRDDQSEGEYLCAYIVPHTANSIEVEQLRRDLQEKLPAYMLPSYFVMLADMPLTTSGKIDKRSLPLPGITDGSQYMAPRNQREELLVKIWSDVLGIETEKIGIDDNFFNLGGHSLKATRLIAHIHRAFDLKLPLTRLFQTPTVRGLSFYLNRAREGRHMHPHSSIEPAEKKEYYMLSSAQKRLHILQRLTEDSTAYNMTEVFELRGFLDKYRLENTFPGLIKRHESLRTSFRILDEHQVQVIHKDVAFEIKYDDASQVEVKVEEEEQTTDDRGQTTEERRQKTKGKPTVHPSSEFIRPFDLSKAPLLRVSLIKVKEEKHILMVDMHHITSDGLSHEILVQDFMALYEGNELPAMRIQYKDFSEWWNNCFKSGKITPQEEYWKNQFEEEVPVLNLPTDYSRPNVQSFAGNVLHFEIDMENTRALKACALKEGTTLYMVLLSIFTILLYKLTSQEDIIVGTPVGGRRHSDLEPVMGMFVNTAALRNYPSGQKSFREFLRELNERTLKAFENQDYPFEDLVEKVEVIRDTSRNPLFDVLFVLQNMELPRLEVPGLQLQPRDNINLNRTAKFDLTLLAVETGKTLSFTFEYCSKLFKEETIQRFIKYFKKVIWEVLGNNEIKLADIEIIEEKEKKQLLVDFNGTAGEFPQNKTIHELFETQVKKTPDEIAILDTDTNDAISYKELNRRASHLAYYLFNRGVGKNELVGIMVERSFEMISGILGILKAGRGYVPLDPGAPAARQEYILAECNIKILLTAREILVGSSNGGICEQPPTAVNLHPAASVAYVIFTSGSTGNPKGVPITHANICPLLHWGYKELGISRDHRTLQNVSYYFDWSVWEIFITLTRGAGLYMAPDERLLNPGICTALMVRYDLTVLHITPTQWQYFLHLNRKLTTLKYLFIGAEKLTVDLVERSFQLVEPGCRVYNMYGPTEATIISTVLEIDKTAVHHYKELSSVPIGKPIGNLGLLVLDKNLGLRPVHQVGELHIYGDGLAGGYLNRPELTAEKFDHDLWDYQDDQDKRKKQKKVTGKKIYNQKFLRGVRNQWVSGSVGQLDDRQAQLGNPLIMAPRPQPQINENQHQRFAQHPGSPRRGAPGRRKQKLYKTGDLVRWLPNGTMEFLGRIDHQVKIRGHRIELGEIEKQLSRRVEIDEVVVIDLEKAPGEKYLCAYIVSRQDIGAEELRVFLARTLPDYMIPAAFMRLEQLPLNRNGKVDRKALPEPTAVGREYTAPGNEIEKKLAAIWKEVLNIDSMNPSTEGAHSLPGIHDNFFELGGHSLKAIQVADKIHKILNVEITIQDLFRFPKISSLANLIQKSKVTRFLEIQSQEKKEYYPLSYSQQRLWFIKKRDRNNSAFNMSAKITLYEAVDKNTIEDVLMNLIIRHESLRTCFKEIAKTPMQFIEPGEQLNLNLEVLDRSHLEESEREKERSRILERESIHIFNLEKAPLFRVKLVKCREEEFDLILNMHHIISDGWSMEILKQEFSRLYEAYKEGIDCEMPPLPLQYKDYATWHNQLLTDEEKVGEAKQSWKKQLSGTLPVLDLPYDSNPGPADIKESAAYRRVIPGELANRLREMAFNHGASLFMVLLAGFKILLSLVTRQDDIILAIPAAARQHEGLENIFGMFVNTLIIRNKITTEESFEDFFSRFRENTFAILKYQGIPLEIICGQLKIKYPTISVSFNMINIGNSHQQNLTTFECYHKEKVQDAKFDIACYLNEYKNGIEINTDYFKDRFNPITIETLMVLYKKVLEKISLEPGTRIGDYNLTREKRKLKRKTALDRRTPITTGEKHF